MDQWGCAESSGREHEIMNTRSLVGSFPIDGNCFFLNDAIQSIPEEWTSSYMSFISAPSQTKKKNEPNPNRAERKKPNQTKQKKWREDRRGAANQRNSPKATGPVESQVFFIISNFLFKKYKKEKQIRPYGALLAVWPGDNNRASPNATQFFN